MFQGRIFSDPLGYERAETGHRITSYGNARLRYITEPFGIGTIPKDLQSLDDKAKQSQKNPYITGSIDQYLRYHQLIVENMDKVVEMMAQSVVIFLPTTSADIPYSYELTDEYPEFTTRMPESATAKRGLSVTSSSSTFGARLLSSLKMLYQEIQDELERGIFPEAQPEKQVLYIPVAPVFTIVEFDGQTITNVFSEDRYGLNLVERVNLEMESAGKKRMGSSVFTDDFQDLLFEYRPSFYDWKRAARYLDVPEDIPSTQYIDLLREHTRYNRYISSFMFSKVLQLLPEDIVYAFIAKTSVLHDIMELAVNREDKEFHKVVIMRNNDLPVLAEAEPSPLRILNGYLLRKLLGSRDQNLRKSDLFK